MAKINRIAYLQATYPLIKDNNEALYFTYLMDYIAKTPEEVDVLRDILIRNDMSPSAFTRWLRHFRENENKTIELELPPVREFEKKKFNLVSFILWLIGKK